MPFSGFDELGAFGPRSEMGRPAALGLFTCYQQENALLPKFMLKEPFTRRREFVGMVE